MNSIHAYIDFLLNKENIFYNGFNGSYINTGPFCSIFNYRKDLII